MKTFLVELQDKSPDTLESQLLQCHVEHLKKLEEQGHLLVCGPFADGSGAMLVLQANNRSEIDEFIQADPFIQNMFYGSYSITEFYKADAANNYLLAHPQTINELNRG